MNTLNSRPSEAPIPTQDHLDRVNEANDHALADACAGRDWQRRGCRCAVCQALRQEVARLQLDNPLASELLLDRITAGSDTQPRPSRGTACGSPLLPGVVGVFGTEESNNNLVGN